MPSLRPVPHAYPLPGILNDQLIRFGSACMRTSHGCELPISPRRRALANLAKVQPIRAGAGEPVGPCWAVGATVALMMPGRVRGTAIVRVVYGVLHGLVLPVWRGDGI